MRFESLKPGDLVTFNAAGSRGKTLALILEIEPGKAGRMCMGEHIPGKEATVVVQWVQTSRFMPRRLKLHKHISGDWIPIPTPGRPQPGEIAMHPFGSMWELANEAT